MKTAVKTSRINAILKLNTTKVLTFKAWFVKGRPNFFWSTFIRW